MDEVNSILGKLTTRNYLSFYESHLSFYESLEKGLSRVRNVMTKA